MRVPHVNRVCIAGRLTQDPVLRKTPSGASAGDFRLAVDDSYTDKEGKMVEQTCFLTVKTWGKTAEHVQQFVGKGDPVLVEGALAYESWEDKEGEKRSRLLVRAQRVHFLKSRPAADAPATDAAAPAEAVGTAAAAAAKPEEDGVPF